MLCLLCIIVCRVNVCKLLKCDTDHSRWEVSLCLISCLYLLTILNYICTSVNIVLPLHCVTTSNGRNKFARLNQFDSRIEWVMSRFGCYGIYIILPVNRNAYCFGFILLLILCHIAALAPLPVDCLSIMTHDYLVFYGVFELWKLWILVHWQHVMQSSNGKNLIEFELTLNPIVFFSGESPITNYHGSCVYRISNNFCVAPCGLRELCNRPDPFPGLLVQMVLLF